MYMIQSSLLYAVKDKELGETQIVFPSLQYLVPRADFIT
jgi:hypothetical protein